MPDRIAFITGINGQDGSYLSELLLSKGYYVYGIIRRMSCINTVRIDPLYSHARFKVFYGDMSDAISLYKTLMDIVAAHKANLDRLEVYNLAAQSHVKISFDMPEYTCDVDGIGTLRLLEVMRHLPIPKDKVFFLQASTSELYGDNSAAPQNENTAFQPVSPYAAAKQFAYQMVKIYRQSYDFFACNAISFNHESPRRGENFLTRKVVIGAARIAAGLQSTLEVGNLEAKRDWGHARDYVEGMWCMLQAESPDDYVLGTGVAISVREFIERAFALAGLPILWSGTGVEEVGRCAKTGTILVRINPRYYRPTEVPLLCADASKARERLGWVPKTDLDTLLKEMMEHEQAKLAKK